MFLFVFRYSYPGPLQGRREGHPHEAHQEDEKSIELYKIFNFYTNFFQDKLT